MLMGTTETIKAPRGFKLAHSDHLGPKRFLKEGKRTRWLLDWTRGVTGAYNRQITGWQVSRWTDRGWVAKSEMLPTPCEAWAARQR